MKKLLPRLLALLLVITMLPISAFASLENHNVSDVTIVQSDNENNYYFPDIVMLPDGRLIACYYQAATHVASNSYGVIYLAESTDNGYTWSEPWKVVDRIDEPVDTRDPNLAVLPNGTLVLTYFLGAGGSGTFMLFSEDGGRTWSEHIQLESDILDMSFGKRGTIAVIDDENMLLPVYGVSSGNNAYGAPATATGKGQFSSYHRDAVMLHYQLVDGEWTLVYESLIGQEIDETALLYTGEGIVDGSTYDGDVWAFSREDGTVRVTKDCGRTWQVMAKEEPRQWTTSGTIMSAEQIIQPRFVQIADGCWFATYASYNNLSYAYDRVARPVYGKVFFPEAGWYATQSKLIYDEVGFGVTDMADPATVLTAEGRLLTIYYNTSTKSIAGTFHDLSDWLDVDEDSLGTKYVERPFWTGAFSSLENAQSMFNVNTKHWSWASAGVTATGQGESFTSKETISGDYSVEFNFKFGGTYDSGSDRDEGLSVNPLYNSNNPNITGGNKFRVRLSATQGAQLIYHGNSAGDYGGVLAGVRGPGGDSLPQNFDFDTMYTVKIAKMGDGLYLKAWETGTTEPGWQAEYHSNTVDVENSSYNWKFSAQWHNKGTDNENILISSMEFNQLVEEEWNYDGKLTKSTYSSNTTNASGMTEGTHGVKWNTDTNGFTVWHGGSHIGTKAISGDFNYSTEFTFQRETVATGDNWKANGMTVFPQYKGYGSGSLASHRINLSTHSGLGMSYSNSWWPGSNAGGALSAGENVVINNDNTSFTVGKTYILEFQKTGNKLYVKAYEKGTTDTNGWDYVVTSDDLGSNYPCLMFYYDTASSSASEQTGFKMNNIDVYGYGILEEGFWEQPLAETEEVLDFTGGWTWPDPGLTTPDSWTTIVSKDTISGDYAAQLDFSLGGVSTDGTTSDRDEGLYILIMEPNSDPTVAGVKQFRIRMSSSEGVQLTYHTNRQGDFGGVCAGKLLSSKGNAASDYVESSLPQSLERNTAYTIKYAKQGDTLSIKVWKAGTAEPSEWQCVYTNSNIDQEEPFDFALLFLNSGTDTENVLVSNAAFSQLVEVTAVNNVGYKEPSKWVFGTMADTHIGGTFVKSGETASSTASGSIVSADYISGNYNASFSFTADGESWDDGGLWLEPVWQSTNPFAGEHQIQLTSDYGIRVFFKGPNITSATMELTDEVVVNDFYYEPGETYNVKISKAYDTLAVKIWDADEAEPLAWNVYWQQASIGSMVYYEIGSYSYPYDFSRYGDLDADGNPYQWRCMVHYESSDDTGITISDLELSKAVEVELNHTELTVNEGEKPLNVELNTTFYPNIFAQLPTPEGCVEYSNTTGNAETTAIIHPAGVRIQRAYVTGVSAGNDTIIASYPSIVDSEGNVVEVTCAVTVNPANASNEFKGISDGYVSEIMFEEDFDDLDIFENATVNETTKAYTLESTSYNGLGAAGQEISFRYEPFYAMSHNAVIADEETGNQYLKTYSGSGSQYSGVRFASNERIQGDYTFQADVYLPSGSAEFRVNVAAQQEWVKPSGENCYILQSSLTSQQKLSYADLQFGFRQWMTRGRLNASVGIYLYDESEKAGGWQTVKVVKAGDTLYFKSWAKGTEEPDWEFIHIDEKIAAAEEAFGGGYLTLEFVSGYTDAKKYSTAGEILMDNVRVTRQVEIDDSTVISDVTLDLGGGTLAEGKDITEYAEGTIVDLPTAEEISREGYIFEGWYDNAEFAGDPITAITADMTGDLTIYAKWEKDPDYIDVDNLGPAVGGIDGPTFEPEVDFVDVPATAWYHEAVEYAVLNGLMNGISDTEFGPSNTLNRAMVVTVLWRLEGEPVANYAMSFTDVPAGQWYTEAIRWAASQGIVNGMDAKTYAPLNAVTREQLVTILYRYAQKKGYDVSVGEDTNILSYVDAFDIAEYAIPAMQWACGAGVINGNDDGSLNPKGNTKRSEFAKVIMNFCENVAE